MINVSSNPPRMITDNLGEKRMMHPLGTVSYLKLEPTNHICFRNQFYDNRRICIQDQFNDIRGNTQFEDIYKIKIHEPTLRELLMIQSIYCCGTVSEVTEIVRDQPTPAIFFKVFLELELKNLLSYLAFDRRSIEHLLKNDVEKHIDPAFPIFFKNNDQKSAIDTALDGN